MTTVIFTKQEEYTEHELGGYIYYTYEPKAQTADALEGN